MVVPIAHFILNYMLLSAGVLTKCSQRTVRREDIIGKEGKMNKWIGTDRRMCYSLNAALALWKREKGAMSGNVGHHQMVEGVKCYFKEFGSYSMNNKRQLNIVEW